MAGDGGNRADKANIEGYVGDSLYPSVYHAAFAPPWIDMMLLREGVLPPRGMARDKRRPFSLLDLGCGDGLGLILNAAAHPASHFIGIDAMPAHIERGRAVAAELGLDNIELRCATFSEALDDAPRHFDYIAAQGVLSWISPQNREHLFALITRNLKDGGVATIGYNCMPGWTPFLSFQKALQMLSQTSSGSPTERFDHAYDQMRSFSQAGLKTLGAGHFEWMDDLRERLPEAYFPHEYLNMNWQPLWSSDVIDQAQSYGLGFVRSGMAQRLRDEFALKAKHREKAAMIEGVAQHELTIDLCLNSQFRTDIFIKKPHNLVAPKRAASARMDGYWMLKKDADMIDYSASTPAGTIRFDNVAARAIVRHLNHGPARLSDIGNPNAEWPRADILNAIDALFVANLVIPVDTPDRTMDMKRIEAINSALNMSTGGAINAALTPYGPVNMPTASIPKAATDDAENHLHL